VLDGVANQVIDDLPQPFLVAVDDHRFGGLQRDRPPGVHDASPLNGLGREAGQVHGPPVQRAPGIEPGQQQEIRPPAAHPAGLAGDQADQPQQFLPAGRVALRPYSASPRTEVSGVRSSWLASAVKRRIRSASRASASRPTSVSPAGRPVRRPAPGG
jgi:hypothetical protein